MATNKEIQAFAIKYYNLYMNPQATFGEATETFADECLTLGFEVMKYGEGLEREYPDENVWDAEGFDEISDDITDVHLLGSAIFLKACKETRSFKDVMNCLFFCPYDTRIRTYVL